jgi:hypothetical protein
MYEKVEVWSPKQYIRVSYLLTCHVLFVSCHETKVRIIKSSHFLTEDSDMAGERVWLRSSTEIP